MKSASHQLEHNQILPQSGWVEHDPVEIWERTASVIQTALNSKNLSASDLDSFGITNQRETTLIWNRHTGRPYYNAIVWQDTRTDRIASELERAGARRSHPAQGRAAPGDLLRRRQDQVAAGATSTGCGPTPRRATRSSAPPTLGCCGT